ncbi:hypothetical protein BT96DRAFT_1003878 [Gymnopus androsaceus JB14]|uniref:DUF4246 domain-containing protein n=1 Tax=Gymnopus androsaceus JB14 TaxID=1447944 RepID=A0A6A4GUH3_9AGAR|nr:hypothetical protein BT96DRAFT_1003878 [Gymnopus androsaceus JB14]
MAPSKLAPSKKKQHHKPTNEDLTHFCLAVKQKNDWETKIMHDKIVLKWAIEAELVPLNSEVLTGEGLEAISELRRSILTIRQLDQNISLNKNPNLDVSSKLEDITSIDSDFKNALKYARGSKYGLCEPELKERGLGVYVSDDLVPASVHQELVRELDALVAKEPRDYHPGSFGKVQDLIHPSLYPYVAGVTPTSSPDIKLPPTGADGKFNTELSNLRTQKFSSAYAWIPSVFKVSPDGTDVRIDSYINGLGHREEHPGLFRVLEKMFLLSLPHFEKTMEQSAEYSPKESPSVARWQTRRDFARENEGSLTKEMWEEFLAKHTKKWEGQKVQERQAKESLWEDIKREQATKESFYDLGNEFAANYTLAPGREYDGSWHMEGMPHERIVASVIYYYDTDSAIEDKGLSFRKFRDSTEDFPAVEDAEYSHEDFGFSFDRDDEEEAEGDEEQVDNYPSDWETELDHEGNPHPVYTSSLPAFIEMGTVPTTNFNSGVSNGTGRMLSFPNWLQHKVESVRNASNSDEGVATRKILCFFLVDDTIQNETWISHHGFTFRGLEKMNVLTTSQIPMQIRKCNEPTFLALLPLISAQLTKGTPLPPELVAIIWEYVSAGTMTREEAEEHRLKLMADRKVAPSRPGHWDTYSLCEH